MTGTAMIQTTDYRPLLKRYAFYAPRYDRLFRRYSAATLSRALNVIPRIGESRLLDVACGTGLLAEMLLEQRPALSFTGVDISPEMLERAKRRVTPQPGKVEWLIGSAEHLPVPDEAFNVVTCTNAFHLVQDAHAALAEFKRVLAPNGTLVLVDWCLDFPVMRLRDAALRLSDRQKRSIRRMDDMVTLIRHAEFEVVKAERFLARRFWGLMCVVARRPA